MCTKDFLRARARAGGRVLGGRRGCARGRARLPIEHERPARRLCRQQLLVQAAVRRVTCGAMGGRGSSGLDRGAVRGAAAAHAIDAVLLHHHERQHVVPQLPCDRRRPWRRVAHLVGRRARMLERAWRGSMEWGRVPPPRAARRARGATRPCSCVSRAVLPACTRFICDRRTHLAL